MKIMGHIIRCYGMGIPGPCKLGSKFYSKSATNCEELGASGIGVNKLNYVSRRTCIRKTILEDRKDWYKEETEALSLRKYKVGR